MRMATTATDPSDARALVAHLAAKMRAHGKDSIAGMGRKIVQNKFCHVPGLNE